MAGTKRGGQQAAATNKAKYGPGFYARIGSIGGKVGRTGGFYGNPELARAMGAKGGRLGRRGPVLKQATTHSARTWNKLMQKRCSI